ncbi:MAG: hypothetical protein AAFX87_12525 [Bacteroidota bacterium]
MRTYIGILVIASTTLFLSCSGDGNSSEGYNESRELVPNPEGYKKDSVVLPTNQESKTLNLIDIDKELAEEFGDYFIDYNNGILSLCCMEALAYPFGSNQKHSIQKYCKDCLDSTYQMGSNDERHDRTRLSSNTCDLTIFSFTHEDGYVEYYLEDSSYYNSPSVKLNNGLKIGTSKMEVYSKYFTSSNDSIYNGLELIAVCPDERGELFTQYRFLNDTLNSIIFGYEMYRLKDVPDTINIK